MNMNAFSTKDSLALKGIAILMMMFHHCFLDASRIAGYDVSFFPFSQSFVVSMSSMFKICVSLFAFISGYGLFLSANTSCNDAKATEKWTIIRIIKTMNGYWFVFVLAIIVTQILSGRPESVYCADGVISGIIYAIIDFFGFARILGTPDLLHTWWYMGAALIYVALVPVIKKSIENLGIVTTSVLIIVIPRILGNGFVNSTSPHVFLFTVFLGVLFAKYNWFEKIEQIKLAKSERLNKIITFIALAVLLLVSLIIFFHAPLKKVWEYHYALYPVIVIIFCKKYIIPIKGIREMLIWFGKHSMNVYLIHTFIRYTYCMDFIYSFKHFLLIGFVLFFISLAISALVIEPLKKLLKYDVLIDFIIKKISCKMEL